jgi:glycosyltransferase involved in cell wall biosynthesis
MKILEKIYEIILTLLSTECLKMSCWKGDIMRGIFLYFKEINLKNPTGIDKKVLAQIKTLNSVGLNCKLVSLSSGLKNDKRGLVDKIKSRLPYHNSNPRWEYIEEFDDLDYLYFRRPTAISIHMRKVLKAIRQRNPRIKIIMEIPTFPYDKELRMTWKDYPISWKDKYNRRYLKGQVDRIVLISGDNIDEVFGIPVLRLYNGVDLNLITPRKAVHDDTIDLCAVAMFAKWHGYDRVIRGLHNYYETGKKRDIKLHMIGAGHELNNYKKLVDDLRLQNHVIFYGMKSGEELDCIYDKMDIGLDVFGMYRKNLSIAYSLKGREYLAKGLPVISGCLIDVFESNRDFKYYLEFPNDETPIDMNNVIEFYDGIYSRENAKEIINSIRNFAEKNCDITVAMRNVKEYLLKKDNF